MNPLRMWAKIQESKFKFQATKANIFALERENLSNPIIHQ